MTPLQKRILFSAFSDELEKIAGWRGYRPPSSRKRSPSPKFTDADLAKIKKYLSGADVIKIPTQSPGFTPKPVPSGPREGMSRVLGGGLRSTREGWG